MHLKKRLTFHGVEYIIVPAELWQIGVSCISHQAADGWTFAMDAAKAVREYENSSEELTDE